jgi:hypothetical protein
MSEGILDHLCSSLIYQKANFRMNLQAMYKNPLILVVEFMSLTFFSSKKVARTGD